MDTQTPQSITCRSAFFGARHSAPKNALRQKVQEARARVSCEAEKKADRWASLGTDVSDDQQDITRGRGMVDSAFQGATGIGGTHSAVMSSYDYISTAQKT